MIRLLIKFELTLEALVWRVEMVHQDIKSMVPIEDVNMNNVRYLFKLHIYCKCIIISFSWLALLYRANLVTYT